VAERGPRYVDPLAPRGRLYLAFVRTQRTGWARWVSRHIVWRLDPVLMGLSRGRVGLGLILPTGLLETTGARTGQRRRNVVIYFNDGELVTIVASKMGLAEHPGWFHNLCADPDVIFAGRLFRAVVVEDQVARDRLWELADRVFPVYADYRAAAARTGRVIPILQLSPR
jgi:deazaflavin-dependent oxidoreductase (nitroreductase family)